MNILRSYLNKLASKKQGGALILLKGSRGWGGGRISLKTFRTSLLNEDLSNEPNFGRIHLAGQYL
jgi:hypothetical protein